MSTGQTLQIKSLSVGDTLRLAGVIGARLRGGEVVELVSDLGGGKTAFTQGLVSGMGSQVHVTSPTFTISNEYQAGDLTVYHFDFYRLGELGIISEELTEVLADPRAIAIIEWGGLAKDRLPTSRLTITFRATGENSRELTFKSPAELAYLLEGLV